MPFFIYSHEPLPNKDLVGKPGYTPDQECIRHGGFLLAELPAQTFVQLPTSITTIRHRDWLDKRGTPERIYLEDLIPAFRNKYSDRGVLLFDHELNEKEKELAVTESKRTHEAWLMSRVQDYEERLRQKVVGEKVPTKVTPYEDYAYTVLGLMKPYSVEAMRAERYPGENVAREFRDAMLEVLEERKTAEARNGQAASARKPAPAGS